MGENALTLPHRRAKMKLRCNTLNERMMTLKKHFKFLLLLLSAAALLTSCDTSDKPQDTTAPVTDTDTANPDGELDHIPLPSEIPFLVWDSEYIRLELNTYHKQTKTETEITVRKAGNAVEVKYHTTRTEQQYTYYEWYTLYADLANNDIYYPVKISDDSEKNYHVAKLNGSMTWQSFLYNYSILMDRHAYAFKDENNVVIDERNYVVPVDVLEAVENIDMTSVKTVCATDRVTVSGASTNGSGTLTVLFRKPSITFPDATRVDTPFSFSQLK